MPLYDADNRLAGDRCAIMTRLRDNESILEYNMYNSYTGCTKTPCEERKKKLQDFSAGYPNLRFTDGYGIAPCDVDGDSRLRHDAQWTNPNYRQQLATRVFCAAPDLSRGSPQAAAESPLLSGEDTTMLRQCQRLVEVNYDRWVPNVDVQCADHVVPPWTWGGDSSRDIARSRPFLESIGYKLEDGGFTCYGAAE